MAQAVYDDHPLQEYLTEQLGEVAGELMPGGLRDLAHDDVQQPTELLPLVQVTRRIIALLSSVRRQSRPSSFVERFKYQIISSPLLDTSLAFLSAPHYSPSHSPPPPEVDANHSVPLNTWVVFAIIALPPTIIGSVSFSLGIITFVVCLVTFAANRNAPSEVTVQPIWDAVTQLITANDKWQSTVREAIETLEGEATCGPSPSSPLRVTLHSSLQSTQSQCDNVRHLLSALASPSQVPQISEMYAPPSPASALSNSYHMLPNLRRPLSLPTHGLTPSRSKRSTWSGLPPRQQRHHSDLTHLAPQYPSSAPVSPSKSLPVRRQPNDEDDLELGDDNGPQARFSSFALDLQRKRRSAGFEALGISLHGTPEGFQSSRFTTNASPRHPLSTSAINLALQGALAARRHACSYLLALRFTPEDDGGDNDYWDDVCSIVGLLTGAFVEITDGLRTALAQAEQQRLREGTPTPALEGTKPELPSRRLLASSSFAPMPDALARFARHVDAISTALDDAKDNLTQTVSSLRDHEDDTSTADLPLTSSSVALQAYDRLRHELGIALRECERGRADLVDVLRPPSPPVEDETLEDLPPLGHDVGSDDSDKAEPAEDDDIPQSSTGPRHHYSGVVAESEGGGAIRPVDASIPSDFLPPPGADMVFEGMSGPPSVIRERSKLSREERIKLMKARRESAVAWAPPPPTWGPGGEIVQELKDVIWQVGERKRRMMKKSPLDDSLV
ncbi:hypothetical protein FISHEDRAFT_75964 [Fistulina hepatica ATCC 64428]|uniref:Myosin-binding domain-containing protein n=1 Tax=Fistulina hepatica ATCC 64428 TaxID=1128425 RepID=A0A0D7A864_9AGAR|nr:hypothetical protein FISHEDRAFT_75964 [Fistulina hepatica ATCC 64428]